MKIEMGESLFYSWLRHVKECQIVQTNWKVSSQWDMDHESEIKDLIEKVDEHFSENYNYHIFKKNSSMSQIIQQGECDVVGVAFNGEEKSFYAVDVAFHEAGLNYGTREETVMKVISKCVRNAVCLYGYMNTKEAEIIFASPKINPAIMGDLVPCISNLNNIFRLAGFCFSIRVIANEAFNELVLQPILLASAGIADTSELFIRSYQMYKMFAGDTRVKTERKEGDGSTPSNKTTSVKREMYDELKIGKLVQLVLKPLIIEKATDLEIEWMQEFEYSKNNFGIQYPLLLKTKSMNAERHYYKDLFMINGDTYRLCCEWFETEANNDRPYVEKWIREHGE